MTAFPPSPLKRKDSELSLEFILKDRPPLPILNGLGRRQIISTCISCVQAHTSCRFRGRSRSLSWNKVNSSSVISSLIHVFLIPVVYPF